MVWAPITALAALIIALIAIAWQFSQRERKAPAKSVPHKNLEDEKRTVIVDDK